MLKTDVKSRNPYVTYKLFERLEPFELTWSDKGEPHDLRLGKTRIKNRTVWSIVNLTTSQD